jgi:CheY-like chemotaxis protein
MLVIEDDAASAEFVHLLLTIEGYAVHVVGDGAAAVAYVRHTPRLPAVILLDLQLPHMDGRAFRALQQATPAWHHIPVIVLSALSNPAQYAAELGVAAVLPKPFTSDHLLAVLAEVQGAPG